MPQSFTANYLISCFIRDNCLEIISDELERNDEISKYHKKIAADTANIFEMINSEIQRRSEIFDKIQESLELYGLSTSIQVEFILRKDGVILKVATCNKFGEILLKIASERINEVRDQHNITLQIVENHNITLH